MATDPDERLTSALDNIDDHGLSGLLKGLIAGTFMTAFFQGWAFIESLGGTIMKPFAAFGDALARLVSGSIGGPVVMLEAATQAAVESLLTGVWGELGIWAYPVTMVSVVAGIYIFARAWEAIDLSPWNFLRNLRR